MASSLFIYIVRDEEAGTDEVKLVVADSELHAKDTLERIAPKATFEFVPAGSIGREDLSDAIAGMYRVGPLDPFTTSAALRYAIEQYGKFLTVDECKTLAKVGEKITDSIFAAVDK